MPSKKVIPVEILDDEGEKQTIHLRPNTQVLLIRDCPSHLSWSRRGNGWTSRHDPISSFDLRPYRPNFRKAFKVRENLWEFFWPKDLAKTEYTWKMRGGVKIPISHEVPDPRAGTLCKVVSTHKLLGLEPETGVIFQHDGEWAYGAVKEYPDWKAEEKTAEKADRRHRRHMRGPTWADRVRGDDLV